MKYTLFLLSLLFPLLSSAQSNYKAGYVVTNAGDTIPGLIDYQERLYTPSSFMMKTNLSSVGKQYTVADCAGFGITGLEYYERHEVSVSQSSAAVVSSLAVGADEKSKIKTIFLKAVQKGIKASLFNYRDAIKLRYYIQDGTGSVPYELVRKIYLDSADDRRIVTGNEFRGQILLLLQKHAIQDIDVYKYVRTLAFDESAFDKTISLINGVPVEKKKTKALRPFAGAGLNATTMSYTGFSEFNNGLERKKTSFRPLLNIGIDVFFNPSIGRLLYRAELSLTASKNEISALAPELSGVESKHSFKQSLLTVTQQAVYNFYNDDQLKVFVAAGLDLNFAKYSDNVYTVILPDKRSNIFNDAVELKGFYISVPVKAGIVIGNRYQLFAAYTLPSVISTYPVYHVNMSKCGIGINYLFNKR